MRAHKFHLGLQRICQHTTLRVCHAVWQMQVDFLRNLAVEREAQGCLSRLEGHLRYLLVSGPGNLRVLVLVQIGRRAGSSRRLVWLVSCWSL